MDTLTSSIFGDFDGIIFPEKDLRRFQMRWQGGPQSRRLARNFIKNKLNRKEVPLIFDEDRRMLVIPNRVIEPRSEDFLSYAGAICNPIVFPSGLQEGVFTTLSMGLEIGDRPQFYGEQGKTPTYLFQTSRGLYGFRNPTILDELGIVDYCPVGYLKTNVGFSPIEIQSFYRG